MIFYDEEGVAYQTLDLQGNLHVAVEIQPENPFGCGILDPFAGRFRNVVTIQFGEGTLDAQPWGEIAT